MTDVQIVRFQFRRGTAAAMASVNEVLLQGEGGFEYDTGKLKIGDGVTHYNSLPYFGGGTSTSGVNHQTGTAYTLRASDENLTVLADNASPFTLTIPTDASATIAVGAKFPYTQYGAGALTIAAQSGVTVHSANGMGVVARYDGGVAEKIGANEWQLWNGPLLATVATSGSYADLTGKPTIPGVTASNEQTGTSYVLVASDASKQVRVTNASAISVTIPASSTTALPLYTPIPVIQGGAGKITILGASGVTLETPAGTATSATGDFRMLYQRATDIWIVA